MYYSFLRKCNLLLLAIIVLGLDISAQDFGGDKVGFGNFIRRMYNSQPFNGVKILQSQEGQDYMISVVELKNDPGKTEAVQSRIASVKAKAYVSQYLNGSNVSTDVIVITKEERTRDSVISRTEMQEILKESSYGFVDGMELLSKFENNQKTQIVFVYIREILKK